MILWDTNGARLSLEKVENINILMKNTKIHLLIIFMGHVLGYCSINSDINYNIDIYTVALMLPMWTGL